MGTRMTACTTLLLLAGVAVCLSRPAMGAKPTSQPATASAPAPAPLDPAVERILDRLEKKNIHDLEADLVYVKLDPILEDEQKFYGILRFMQDKPNPRFFIHFDRIIHDGIPVKKPKEWHVFDGQWYLEAREKTGTIVKRRIVRPGEKIDVFRIGKGPFPLPFGQKKEEIVRYFVIKLVPPSPKDPKNTKNSDHLECTPLPGTELHKKYGKVHFYVDRKLDLPICVRTVAKDEGNEITASFSKIRLNRNFAASRLNLPDLGYPESVESPPSPGGPKE